MALALNDPEEHERTVWKTLMFMSRYGHQRIPDLLDMEKRDLDLAFNQLIELMKLEGDGIREKNANGEL